MAPSGTGKTPTVTDCHSNRWPLYNESYRVYCLIAVHGQLSLYKTENHLSGMECNLVASEAQHCTRQWGGQTDKQPLFYLGLVMWASLESSVCSALIFSSVSLRTTCRGCVFTTLRVAGLACMFPTGRRFIMRRLRRPLAAVRASTMAFRSRGVWALV